MSLLDLGLTALTAPRAKSDPWAPWLVGAIGAVCFLAMAKLVRLQHPAFGTELRALLTSRRREDRDAAEAVVVAMDELMAAKARGDMHPNEDAFTTTDRQVSGIRYLRLYPPGHSIRVYFMQDGDQIYMLGLDAAKRRTAMTSAMKDMLSRREAEILAMKGK